MIFSKLFVVVTLEGLLAFIDDPDQDAVAVYEMAEELAASGDLALVPRLEAAIDDFVADENFHGRDVIATALSELIGPGSLDKLLLVSAVDIGDDQDTFQSIILGVIGLDVARARDVVAALGKDAGSRVREVAAWASEMVDFAESQARE